jgi:hypothetical protein
VATLSNLVDKLRVELGDLGKSFVTSFVADGTTNRFSLHYAPLDGAGVLVTKNNIDISNQASVEEHTGIMVLDVVPEDGDEIMVTGNYYRYFTSVECEEIINNAIDAHSDNHVDVVGRKLGITTLPINEEYPVVVYATSLALYTLATDAAFDIDIAAPDGVNIPRSERYRQLTEMIQVRKEQYRELCVHLGVGMFKIDVFKLDRISKATGRLIPKYAPQQVDDRSFPQRVDVPAATYGNVVPEWPTTAEEITAYQGRSFSISLDFIANYAGKYFIANVLPQRAAPLAAQAFTLSVATTGTDVITAAARTSGSTTVTLTTSAAHGLTTGNSVAITNVDSTVNGIYTIVNATPTGTTFTITTAATTALALTGLNGQVETNVSKDYTFTLSLTKDQTLHLAERTYWSLSMIDAYTSEQIEIKGGNFFTVRSSTVVI